MCPRRRGEARQDIDFFRWLAGFNDLSGEAFLALCPVRDPVMILYSDGLLALHDIAVDANRGPKDQDLNVGVTNLGRTETVCYME